jgi:hypothetical protein
MRKQCTYNSVLTVCPAGKLSNRPRNCRRIRLSSSTRLGVKHGGQMTNTAQNARRRKLLGGHVVSGRGSQRGHSHVIARVCVSQNESERKTRGGLCEEKPSRYTSRLERPMIRTKLTSCERSRNFKAFHFLIT